MRLFIRPNAKGFSLVEVVLSVGIFSFAIVGVVFLLGTALQSSSETQRDSALSSALQTATAIVQSYDNSTDSAVLYFDQQGSLVTNPNSGHYKFELTAVSGTGLPSNLEFWTVQASSPPPAFPKTGRFLISRLKK